LKKLLDNNILEPFDATCLQEQTSDKKATKEVKYYCISRDEKVNAATIPMLIKNIFKDET